MNPFQNPFQEYAGNQSRLARVAFQPRYARDKETGDRRQGEIAYVALFTTDATTCEAPAFAGVRHGEAVRCHY